jgi:predicted transcriptional regulator
MRASLQSVKMAECVGLWLAEGDDKTKSEITFTNNSEMLIRLFYRMLRNTFPDGKFRLYVYSPNSKYNLTLSGCRIRVYKDIRATKPYYILRYASVKDVIKWKKIVSRITSQRKYFPHILRGFFAGEGNIKVGSHSSRAIRIAQKEPLKIIDSILNSLIITYKFSSSERAYRITGRANWEKFYKHKIYTLHPEKKKRFLAAWTSYKEIHYPNNFIRNTIFNHLSTPKTCRELAKIFNRKPATLQDVLCELKRNGKVKNYKCRSTDYWLNYDSKIIVISYRKKEILDMIFRKPSRVSEISRFIEVDGKSVKRRLQEMERLGLAVHNGYLWMHTPTQKEVVAL